MERRAVRGLIGQFVGLANRPGREGRYGRPARLVLADSVSMAMPLVLETLTPTERAVFVLREVLDLGEPSPGA